MEELVYVGVFLFVAIAASVFLLCRERKAKSTELGPRAADANFAQQREDRNA